MCLGSVEDGLVFWWLVLVLGSFFACPAGATAQPLAAGCLLAAIPLRDSSYPVGAGPPYGWGCLLRVKPLFLLWEKRDVLSCSCFFACPAGAKTTVSFDSKETAVLDSEKEKVDRWK